MKRRILCYCLSILLAVGSVLPALGEGTAVENRVKQIVDSMTLRQKITQMMMIDFRNWNGSGFTVMNDQVRKIVAEYQFGALIYFAPNMVGTEQVYNLTKEMQAAATQNGGLPMIITADQEGGMVYRLGSGTALPGNMAVGAAGNTEYAKVNGKIIGRELSSLGLNSTLAPVVDVNNNANNSVIGLRSYGDNPTLVGQMASAQLEGLNEYGVIGCLKHFPGHGDTATDSHYGLPVVDKSYEQLKNCELKPYEIAVEQGVDMIMTAHILYPQLEKDTVKSNKTGKNESLPATLSDDILTELLKKQMGFEGIITTDAMNMAGIANYWDMTQSSVLAINAGVDMLCMPTSLSSENSLNTLNTIINGIEQAVNNGTIPMSRINDAVTRIITVKANRGILDGSMPSLEEAKEIVGGELNRQVERELSAAAVTVVQNKNNTFPLSLNKNSKVLFMVPYQNEIAQMAMGWNRAKEAGIIPQGAQMKVVHFTSSRVRDVQSDLDWADTVVINSEISSAAKVSSNNYLYAGVKAFVDYAKEQGKIAVVQSVDKPYDLQLYPNADGVLAVYGCIGSSIDPTEALVGGSTADDNAYGPNIIAGIEVALGVFGATGTLPVSIPQYQNGTYTNEIVYEQGYGLTYSAKHTHSLTLVDDPACYTKAFYQCDGCGMWFWEEKAQTQIIDKFALLGVRESQSPQEPENPDDPTQPDPPAPMVVYGDVNKDEAVDAKDALMVLKVTVGKIVFTQEQALAAEVDGKDGINAKDALEILKKTVGKIQKFPVEE